MNWSKSRRSISDRLPWESYPREPSNMSDLVGYSHDFLAEFIHLYRSFRCLWQVRYRGYKDRILRNRAYDALVQKLREVNPIADKETVIRKINTLRTAFRREYKKVRNSQKMVQNPRLRYRSSLWYYDILKFVAEQNETSPLDEERDFKNALANPTDLSQEEMMVRPRAIFLELPRLRKSRLSHSLAFALPFPLKPSLLFPSLSLLSILICTLLLLLYS